MLSEDNLFNKQINCQKCIETVQGRFKYIECSKEDKFVSKTQDSFVLIFLIEGKALISCNEFMDIPIKGGEIALCPVNSIFTWISMTRTATVILEATHNVMPICNRISIKKDADTWLNVIPNFPILPIKERLMQFLYSIKNYLEDGIICPYMHKYKQLELSLIFREYYSPEELRPFFLPTVCNMHEFEIFVMNNYLKIKGVKEFVDLSGMNLKAFNQKFKDHFNISPYQWLIKQKSKHIYYELSSTDKSFSRIAKEFKFTDASHFNRYCKSMFGGSPSQIRKSFIEKNKEK